MIRLARARAARPSGRTSLAGLAVLALLATPSLAACSRSERSTTDEGPLRVLTDHGSRSLHPPSSDPSRWQGTFGSLLLCVEDPSSPVTLTGVSYSPTDSLPDGGSVTPAVHTDPGEDGRTGGGDWGPVLFRLGTPRRFLDAPHHLAGPVTAVAGAPVQVGCSTDADQPFVELLTTFEVGRAGGRVDGIEISYRAGGREHRTHVDYTFAACGTSITDEDLCPAP